MASFITSNLRIICYISILTSLPCFALALTSFAHLFRHQFKLFNLEDSLEDKINSTSLELTNDLLTEHYLLKTQILKTQHRIHISFILSFHLLCIAGCFISLYNPAVILAIAVIWIISFSFLLTLKYKLHKKIKANHTFLNSTDDNIMYIISSKEAIKFDILSNYHFYIQKKALLLSSLVHNSGIFITCLLFFFIHKAI